MIMLRAERDSLPESVTACAGAGRTWYYDLENDARDVLVVSVGDPDLFDWAASHFERIDILEVQDQLRQGGIVARDGIEVCIAERVTTAGAGTPVATGASTAFEGPEEEGPEVADLDEFLEDADADVEE